MTRLFITSTGTGIGKTFVTAALTHQALRDGKTVRAIKPVVSGFDPQSWADSDPAVLLEAMNSGGTTEPLGSSKVALDYLDDVSPWRFEAPLSPDMAAAREGRSISFSDLMGFCHATLAGPEDLILIEGIGGIMVPLDEKHTVLELIIALSVPVLLVVGSYLGTLSHTLTAIRVLRDAGVTIDSIILSETPNSPPLQETAKVIKRFAGVPIRILPHQPTGDWRLAPRF